MVQRWWDKGHLGEISGEREREREREIDGLIRKFVCRRETKRLIRKSYILESRDLLKRELSSSNISPFIIGLDRVLLSDIPDPKKRNSRVGI